MTTFIVTGGAGFIGSHTVDALIDNHCDVIVVDSLWKAGGGREEYVNKDAILYQYDIRGSAIRSVFSKHRPDYVYHFAAQHSVGISAADPEHDIDVNLTGLLNILRLCVEFSVKRLIFSSSIETYGIPDELPITEDTVQRPTSPYGITKLAAEHYIRYWHETYGLEYDILRCSNVYGPRQDFRGESGVISIFARNIMLDEPIRVDWDGEQKKDFVYIDDIVKANLLMLNDSKSETYCIGSESPISVNEIYEMLTDIIGKGTDMIPGKKRPGDMPIRYASHAKIWNQLGWRPSVSMLSGMTNTVEWLKSRL